ncbi:dynein light chain Tctex-type protein 2B-like [Rhodnius prolixus]
MTEPAWWRALYDQQVTKIPRIPPFKKKRDATPYIQFTTKPGLEYHVKWSVVKQIAEGFLRKNLAGKKYSEHEDPGELTRYLANTIRAEVEEYFTERHKLVVHVLLGDHNSGGVQTVLRCFWDLNNDNYTSAYFANPSLFCVVMIIGTYYY